MTEKSHDRNPDVKKAGESVFKGKREEVITEKILCAEYEAVYRYVLSLCRDTAEAQDITQETFLKAMRASDSFEGKSSLYTWLCSIAKRQWLNNCKKHKRETFSEDMVYGENLASGDKPVEQLVAEKDTAMHIHGILHGMNEPYKEVFTLRVFGQLSFSEIAKLFMKTESWARVTYHRAVKTINEKMRKDGYYE